MGGSTLARILDGRLLAARMYEEVAGRLAALRGSGSAIPGVAIVIVGHDPASRVYARQILRAAERVGTRGSLVELPPDASLGDVHGRLRELNADDSIGGVIFQLPLPSHLDRASVAAELDPAKDIDGIHPLNAGRVAQGADGFAPSCAEAAIETLRRQGIPIAGRRAVVIGRSNVVGRPAALLLLREHATVVVCHRQTRDLASEVRRAEIVVVAAGSPGLVTGAHLRPGAVVIDCGINVLGDGRLTGDVDMASAVRVASAVTPVPGGVGPVTNAVLMEHLARAVLGREMGRRASRDPDMTGPTAHLSAR